MSDLRLSLHHFPPLTVAARSLAVNLENDRRRLRQYFDFAELILDPAGDAVGLCNAIDEWTETDALHMSRQADAARLNPWFATIDHGPDASGQRQSRTRADTYIGG